MAHSFVKRSFAFLAGSCFAALGLAGCGAIHSPSTPGSITAAKLSGKVMGGQQPITGSTVTVWQMGSAGYGSAATQLAQTTTASDGSFSVGTYTCPTPDTQVYITAQGGEATPGFNNSAILLAAGLGNCSAAQSQVVDINEVTTVATAYALNQFMAYPLPSSDSFGAPPADLAYLTLANTATIPTLVNLATGTVNPNTSSITIEAAKIYSIANTLAACANSTAADTTTCSTLFTDTSYASADNTPDNTLEAAAQMAELPAQDVAALYNLAQPTAPFVGLSQAPNDWTVAVAYTTPTMGLGIAPTANSATSSSIDIDATGRIWFPSDLPGSTGMGYFDPATSTFRAFLASVFTRPQYVAIDSTGVAWVTDQAGPEIGLLNTTRLTSIHIYYALPAGVLNFGPMTADTSGGLFFAYTDSTNVPNLGYLNNDDPGGPLDAFTYFPTGLAVPSFGIYASTSGLATPCAGEQMSYNGSTFTDFVGLTTTSDCTSGGVALATGNSDGLTVATSLNQICSGQSGSCFTPAPLNLPEGIATDGFGEEWVANSGNGSVTTFGSSEDSPPYDQISPVAFLHDATHGATMTAPYGIAIDGAGNVWVSNASCISATTTPCTPTAFQLTELIGAAGPTITPLSAQDGGSLAGTEPALAGHSVALSHRGQPVSLNPHPASSAWPFGHASANSQSRPPLPSSGVPWLMSR